MTAQTKLVIAQSVGDGAGLLVSFIIALMLVAWIM